MSLNNIISPLKRLFAGRLRPFWITCAIVLCHLAWTTLAAGIFTWLFALLFDAWGLNTLNLHLAPSWARAVVNAYPYAVSLLVNIPVILAASAALSRVRARSASLAGISKASLSKAPSDAAFSPDEISLPGSARSRPALISAAFAAGLLAIALPYVLFILTDSMRMLPASPEFNWAVAANLPVCIAAAWAEQLVSRSLIPDMDSPGRSAVFAYAASAAVLTVMTRPWQSGIIAIPNLVLLSVFLCALTRSCGSAPAAALRAGWMWASSSLVGVTGSEISVFSLYPVSESVFTGGASGIMNGLFLSVMLIAASAYLLRAPIAGLIRSFPRKKARARS